MGLSDLGVVRVKFFLRRFFIYAVIGGFFCVEENFDFFRIN